MIEAGSKQLLAPDVRLAVRNYMTTRRGQTSVQGAAQAEVVEGEVLWPSPLRSRLDHFNQYGVGMRLYFDFLLVAE